MRVGPGLPVCTIPCRWSRWEIRGLTISTRRMHTRTPFRHARTNTCAHASPLTHMRTKPASPQTRERGHMHIADMVAHSHKFHNEAILLIHFSSRLGGGGV